MRKAPKPLPPGLVLRCGCQVTFREGEQTICPRHGAQGVARTVRMPAPRFVGMATGPHVKTQDMSAYVGRLAGSETKDKAHG